MCLPPHRDWENHARNLNIALHKSIPSELDLSKRRHCSALPAVSQLCACSCLKISYAYHRIRKRSCELRIGQERELLIGSVSPSCIATSVMSLARPLIASRGRPDQGGEDASSTKFDGVFKSSRFFYPSCPARCISSSIAPPVGNSQVFYRV